MQVSKKLQQLVQSFMVSNECLASIKVLNFHPYSRKYATKIKMGFRETAVIRDLSNWRRHSYSIFRQSLRVVVMTFMS